MENYKEALKVDQETSAKYYNSSLQRKTEQQKLLEALLQARSLKPLAIADIACGGGGSTYHLAGLYPDATYTLVDRNEDAIALARQATSHLKATCLVGDIYDLKVDDNAFDLVVCWQTLSWIEEPERAVRELVRICKPGARIYASSLFNVDHDVDVYSQVEDHTRPSAARGLRYVYNTYAQATVQRWVEGLVAEVRIHKFEIPIDLLPSGRGLGTYTARMEGGPRLQFSAGMLLNWGILELQK